MYDLELIKRAKILAQVVFEVTDRSPKKFRFTLITRMQNLALGIISDLYYANDIMVNTKVIRDIDKTLKASKGRKIRSESEYLFYQTKIYQLKLVRAAMLENQLNKRWEYCYSALNKIRQLDYFISLADITGCILKKQKERIAVLLFDIRNMTAAYIRADKKRYLK